MVTETNLELLEQGFRISGDLSFSTVSSLIEKGKEQINQISSDLVKINLNSVDRVDSAGIALLLAWKRDCLSVKKSCEFQGVPQQTMSLIETYQLQSVLL